MRAAKGGAAAREVRRVTMNEGERVFPATEPRQTKASISQQHISERGGGSNDPGKGHSYAQLNNMRSNENTEIGSAEEDSSFDQVKHIRTFIRQRRRDARRAFRKEQYEEAVKLYSEAIKASAAATITVDPDSVINSSLRQKEGAGHHHQQQQQQQFNKKMPKKQRGETTVPSLPLSLPGVGRNSNGAQEVVTETNGTRPTESILCTPEEHSRLLLGRASGWICVGEYRNAVQDADAAVQLSPRSPRAYAKRGQALLKLQAYKEASDTFLKGLEHGPTNQDLTRGFDEAIRGLRSHYHQYYPAFGHGGITQYEERFYEPNLSYARPPRKNKKEEHVDPTLGKDDPKIMELLRSVGALLEIEDIFHDEEQWWQRHSKWEFNREKVYKDVVSYLETHRFALYGLFAHYCEKISKGNDIEMMKYQVMRLKGGNGNGGSSGGSAGAGSSTGVSSSSSSSNSGAGSSTAAVKGENVNNNSVSSNNVNSNNCNSNSNSGSSCTGSSVKGKRFGVAANGRVLGGWSHVTTKSGTQHTPHFHPIHSQRNLSHEQFMQMMVDTRIVTEKFNHKSIEHIWRQLHRGARPGAPSAEWSILFPKFLEGLIRVTMARYRPTVVKATDPEGTTNTAGRGAKANAGASARHRGGAPRRRGGERGARPPDISERMTYAFQQHLLSHPKADTAKGAEMMSGLMRGKGTRKPYQHPSAELGAETSHQGRFSSASSTHRRTTKGSRILPKPPAGGGKGTSLKGRKGGPRSTGIKLKTGLMNAQGGAWGFSSPPVMKVLDRFRPRLHKVFVYFGYTHCNNGLMDPREFIYMLRELNVLDKRNLSARVAVQIMVAVIGFIGVVERKAPSSSFSSSSSSTSSSSSSRRAKDTSSHAPTVGEMNERITHAGDLLTFDKFVDTIARCYEVKTYDGIVPLDRRLQSCFAGDLFQKVRHRTSVASLWM